MFCTLYAFFWVIRRRLEFICRRFGTLCLFQLHRQVDTYLPMKVEQTECLETSAYKLQTPGNYPKESKHHTYTLTSTYKNCSLSCPIYLFVSYELAVNSYYFPVRGGADKSLARPGRKQATAIKLRIYSTYSPRSPIHFLALCSNF